MAIGKPSKLARPMDLHPHGVSHYLTLSLQAAIAEGEFSAAAFGSNRYVSGFRLCKVVRIRYCCFLTYCLPSVCSDLSKPFRIPSHVSTCTDTDLLQCGPERHAAHFSM